MEIEASSTCKYLSNKGRKEADLRNQCCTLRMVATCKGDSQVLLAIYRCYMDGGTINVESPKSGLKMKAEIAAAPEAP